MDKNVSVVEDTDNGNVSIKRESSPSATIFTKSLIGLRWKAGDKPRAPAMRESVNTNKRRCCH
jgi:hypothetical protein